MKEEKEKKEKNNCNCHPRLEQGGSLFDRVRQSVARRTGVVDKERRMDHILLVEYGRYIYVYI